MIRRLLKRLGFVSADQYATAIERQRKAEKQAIRISQQLGEARVDARNWKTKADEAHAALKKSHLHAAETLQKAQARAAEAEKQARQAESQRAEAERRAKRTVEVEALQTELANAERELTLAREQLMAIEVKLDILEGAANVLDGRTRSIYARGAARGEGAGV